MPATVALLTGAGCPTVQVRRCATVANRHQARAGSVALDGQRGELPLLCAERGNPPPVRAEQLTCGVGPVLV